MRTYEQGATVEDRRGGTKSRTLATFMRRNPDIVIGIGLLLFCGFAAWRTLKVRVPPEATIAGTSFLPWVMIGGITLLSLALIARAARRAGAGDRVALPDRAVLVRMGLFTVLMIAYAFAFMTVGYIASTLVVFVLGLLILGERRFAVVVLFPIVMTAAIYLGFTQSLGVWLP